MAPIGFEALNCSLKVTRPYNPNVSSETSARPFGTGRRLMAAVGMFTF